MKSISLINIRFINEGNRNDYNYYLTNVVTSSIHYIVLHNIIKLFFCGFLKIKKSHQIELRYEYKRKWVILIIK